MRISQKTEWVLIAVLVAYIAFTPGVQAVRDLLSTGVGKAVYLAAVVAAWKYVSPLVSILLVVNFVRCASMREFADDPSMKPASSTAPPNTHCPDDYKFENGQCKGMSGQTVPATVCLAGQTWDGNKCVGSATTSTTTPPPTVTPPPSTSSTTTKQPFSNMTPAPVVGGVQPDMKEKFSEQFAPAM